MRAISDGALPSTEARKPNHRATSVCICITLHVIAFYLSSPSKYTCASLSTCMYIHAFYSCMPICMYVSVRVCVCERERFLERRASSYLRPHAQVYAPVCLSECLCPCTYVCACMHVHTNSHEHDREGLVRVSDMHECMRVHKSLLVVCLHACMHACMHIFQCACHVCMCVAQMHGASPLIILRSRCECQRRRLLGHDTSCPVF